MGLANKLKLEFVLSMNGNFRVYIFMCDECICMVHSWALGFVKLNMACEPLSIIVIFIYFLSIENFFWGLCNPRRSPPEWWSPKTPKTLCNSIVSVLGFLGPCLSRFKFMHFIIACVDEWQSVCHVSRN